MSKRLYGVTLRYPEFLSTCKILTHFPIFDKFSTYVETNYNGLSISGTLVENGLKNTIER